MAPTGATVLGVDGCPGGWVGVLLDERGRATWRSGDFAEMLSLRAGVTAVDIPIGLPTGGERRRADNEARDALGAQRSSVFFTPPRVALEAGTQAEATRLSRAAGGKGVSIQTFWILEKVAEVDAALCDAATAARVVEVHPEVSFRRLGGLVLAPKRTATGRAQRLELLRTWLPGLELPEPRPRRAAVDDCLDALAAAWSGARWLAGTADVLGGELDALGRPMRIVV